MSDVRLITVKDVMQKCQMSRATLYRLLSEGRFPAPVYYAPRVPRWTEKTVDDWIAALGRADQEDL